MSAGQAGTQGSRAGHTSTQSGRQGLCARPQVQGRRELAGSMWEGALAGEVPSLSPGRVRASSSAEGSGLMGQNGKVARGLGRCS